MTEKDEQSPEGAPAAVAPEETRRTWPPDKEAAIPAPEPRTPGPEVAAAPPVTPTPPPEKPPSEDRVGQLEAEKGELRDRMLRIAAEFENFKKRARRELSDAESKGKEQVLRDMLEVIDNLERALAASGEGADSKGIQQGVTLVLRLFQSK